MVWLSLAASLLFSAGGVCVCVSCFHAFVLLPMWRRSMRSLRRMTDDDERAVDDVVLTSKMAEGKAGRG